LPSDAPNASNAPNARSAHPALRSRVLTEPLAVFRVADGRYPLLDGQGAARVGGRWNTAGRPVVYGAGTYAGAMLEVLVHANIGRVPRHHVAVEITLPAGIAVATLEVAEAPGWDDPALVVSRAIGDAWLRARESVALFVPSVVAPPYEQNVVLDPAHPDFARLRVSAPEPVRWDARLFRPPSSGSEG
jgi:RES domain-containing protein